MDGLPDAPAPALWFEFLLNPDKLREHLESDNCDPSPTELINLFLRSAITGSNLEEKTYCSSPNASSSAQSSTNNTTPKTEPKTIPLESSLTTSNEESKIEPTISNDKPINIPDFKSSLPGVHDPKVNEFPPDTFEAEYHVKKCYGLQILAIRVASFLNWDLDLICKNLSVPIQLILMHSFMRTINSGNDEAPIEVKNFLAIIYSHWLLRSSLNQQLLSLQPQSHNTTIIYLSQYQQQQQATDNNVMNHFKELMSPTSHELIKWTDYLQTFVTTSCDNLEVSTKNTKRLKTGSSPFDKVKLLRPKMNCFDVDLHGKPHDWTECESINAQQLLESACYDLGRFYFFKESYDLASKSFELIKSSKTDQYPHLVQYLDSARKLVSITTDRATKMDGVIIKKENNDSTSNKSNCKDETAQEPCNTNSTSYRILESRRKTEKYLFDCMTQYSAKMNAINSTQGPSNSTYIPESDCLEYLDLTEFSKDSDLRFNVTPSNNINHQTPHNNSRNNNSSHQFQPQQQQQQLNNHQPNNRNQVLQHNQKPAGLLANNQSMPSSTTSLQGSNWYLPANLMIAPCYTEANKGELFMSQGNCKEAMACFLGALIHQTDYFRKFSKNYQTEEPYISRMIQCSISLSCFTQAVALCQMSKSLNYTIAFKQLNERICNDCCDDIYECIWNVTLLEYIINLHSKRGEADRRSKVMQLIGQLELNENNPEEIAREAEQVRRGKFFRILANKYL